MATVTINKSLTKGQELVVIPRQEYEGLLRITKEKNSLDKELAEALREVKNGKIIGPFKSIKELKKSLER